MRRFASIIAIVAAVLGIAVTAGPTFAQGPTGSVVASVQVSVGPCITVAPTSFTYAPQGFSTTSQLRTTVTDTPASKPVVTSCSDRPENILVRGDDATGQGGIRWLLTDNVNCSSQVTDRYVHAMRSSTSGSSYTFVLSNEPQLWEAGLPATGTSSRTIDSQLTMPCTGSNGLSNTMSLPILLTAVIP